MVKDISNRGLTFIEVIVSMIVITLISATSWMAITVLAKSGQISQNYSNAVNILNQSQEEVERISRVSQIFFDKLENCNFPTQEIGGDTCGFEDISLSFPGFTRYLEVSEENDSTELKRVLITVRWNESMQSRELYSIALLSRPPDPLPGNIIGIVRSSGPSNSIVENVTISASLINGSETHATRSQIVMDEKGANFDFIDTDSGRFVLTAGNWAITAQHDSYYPFVHSDEPQLIVEANQEVFINIELEPKPDDATIYVNVVDHTNNDYLVDTFNSASMSIYKNGSLFLPRVYNRRETSFTIPFEDADQQCFTLNTYDAYRSAYAAFPSCSYIYDREGWSSSIYQEDGSLVCSNSRNGHTSSDRICVSPAEEITVDIPLSPVPEVNIYGRVIDSIGNPIGGAVIQALWPRSDSAYWRKGGALQTATTQMDGSFVFSVPAVQAMFPDSNPYNNYLRVWANARVELRSCCDTLTKQNRNSATKEVGPLNIGDSDRNIGDLIISTLDISCGNVTGKIKNDFTENPLPDVTAIIYSQTEITNGLGKYIYDCPEEGYRLSAGNASFIARHNGYYEYRSDGNNWYNRGPNVNIVANEVSEYDAVLWPRGYGNIEVIVLDERTAMPVPGSDVVLKTYTNTLYNDVTNSSGIVDFVGVEETWPPADLPTGNSYYNYGERIHSVNVSHTSGVYLPVNKTISVLNKGENITITVYLKTQGGL